jgi:phage terminase small subunit
MPVLENERHKLFAQQLAQGKTATEAYVLAGFRAHRGNAARLGANERVNARVLEIQAASAKSAEITIQTICGELDDGTPIKKK